METLIVTIPTTDDEWTSFEGRELDAKLAELNVAQRRIEAAMVAATGAAERSGQHLVDGHRTVASWVMATTNCARGEATARARCADLARDVPVIGDAFADGRVGIAQVRELARLAAHPRAGDQLDGSAEILLDAARQLEYADFRTVTKRWEQLADADGAHREHEHAHEDRNARISFDGAMVRFETVHGIIQGTSMRNVFDAFCEAEFQRDWRWVRDTYGADGNRTHLPRTAAQRRADAFSAMILAAAEAGTGDGRSIDATVNLVCDLDQFERHVEADLTDTTVTGIDPAGVRDRRCETTDGHPVDPRQLIAAAALGRIRTIVVDGAGIIIAAGRTRQLFTGALREAIVAIDPVCGWLGCNLRAQISAIDHLIPRSRGGPTDAGNGKVMCDHHNVFKHTAGYTVERQPDGTILITRPDATPLRPPDAA